MRWAESRCGCLLAALAVWVGCAGDLGSELAGPALTGVEGGPSEPTAPGDTGSGAAGGFASEGFDKSRCEDRELSPGHMPGLVRLTHRQYDFIVRDVLGVDARASADFVADQSFYGFDNNAENLAAPQNQVLRYRATAERVAAEAAAAPDAMAAIVPCVIAVQDAACRAEFIDELLGRLLRRPLSADERSRYSSLFSMASDLYDEGDAFERGMRLTLEALLQSPAFLYRAELRDTPLDGRVVPLTSHEIAARLALTLWASVPDGELWELAEEDALTTEESVAEQARRMLDDPRAERAFDDFHAQWLTLDKLHYNKDPETFTDFDEDAFGTASRESMLAFTRYVGLEADGSVADLYTAPVAFVNEQLAAAYGFDDAPEALTRMDTDPEERSGLLTQVGFLAGHADALHSSPIHRGAFIQKRVLCATLGTVPGNVGELPARTDDIVTTRDQVEAKTDVPGCRTCHEKINPAGFAFEAFDTLGGLRTHDNGEPVDTRASLDLDGETRTFDGAQEFGQLLSESETARRCYETEWFRYGMGRGESEEDLCLLAAVEDAASAQGGSIKETLVALAASRGFRFRAQEDLP